MRLRSYSLTSQTLRMKRSAHYRIVCCSGSIWVRDMHAYMYLKLISKKRWLCGLMWMRLVSNRIMLPIDSLEFRLLVK
jgi:hypothetical protein